MQIRKQLIYKTLQYLLTLTLVITMLLPVYTVVNAASSILYLTVISPNQITLDWTDNLSNETGYRVEKRIDTGDFNTIAWLSPNTAYFTDWSVSAGHTYTYRIVSHSATSGTAIHTNEATTTSTALTAPASLTVTQVSSSRLDLSWYYQGYVSYSTLVERRTGTSGTWTPIATLPAGTSNYSDTGLNMSTTYYYRVKAVSGPYVQSLPYPLDNIGKPGSTKLKEPTGLSGKAISASQIHLTWTDQSNESAFVVERKNTNDENFKVVATLPANTVSWLDTGVEANSWYIYRVKAITETNASEYSNEITVTSIYLKEPTGVTARAVSNSQVELSWTDNSTQESEFEIWKRTDSSQLWEKIATVGRNVTSFTDRDLNPDTLYYYKVRASIMHRGIYSNDSSEVKVWTILLPPPSDLRYTVITPNSVWLEWKDNSNNENGFAIERKTGVDGKWVQIASFSANITGYSDSNIKESSVYFYRVKVFENTYYHSECYSDVISVSTAKPQAPSELLLETVSPDQVRLTWADRSNNETGFKIERRRYGQVFKEVAQVGADVTSYVDKELSAGKRYYYRIRAFNKAGNSSYTKEASIETTDIVTFKDVKRLYWAKEEIENLAGRGVFKKGSDGLFKPEEKVTRGEFVSSLVKGFKLNKVVSGSLPDVNQKHPYYNEIMIADKVGIIPGNGKERFYPDVLITREEAAVFTARALKSVDKPIAYYDPSIMDEFSDRNKIDPEALSSMVSLYGVQVFDGKTIDGSRVIDPLGNITRAEMAVILYRVLEMGVS